MLRRVLSALFVSSLVLTACTTAESSPATSVAPRMTATRTAARVTNGLGRKRSDRSARLPRRRHHRIRPVRPGHRRQRRVADPSGRQRRNPAARHYRLLGPARRFQRVRLTCLVLSPDGRQVAIAYDDRSGMFGDDGVRKTQILDLEGYASARSRSSCGGCGSIQGVDIVPRAWSRDGTVVAVVRRQRRGPEPPRDGVGADGRAWAVDPSDRRARRLPDRILAGQPAGALPARRRWWHVDGGHAAGTAEAASSWLRRLALRQVSPRGWTVAQDDYIGPAASYSPDGSRIAFVADDGSGRGPRLYVVDADGGTPEAIAGPAAAMTTAAWSPDGEWIAFDGSINGGPHDVYAVHPDGSRQVDLRPGTGNGSVLHALVPGLKGAAGAGNRH